MLFVFGQLIQNSIFYYIVNNKRSLTSRRNKTINPFKRNQINDLKGGQTESDEREFLHAFISVRLDRDSPDYIPMKFDLISRLVFCFLIIFFLAVYWPNTFKLSSVYNLFAHTHG